MGARRDCGTVRRLPSGSWQACYSDARGTLRAAPQTFWTRAEAGSYLAWVHTEQDRCSWVDPAAGVTSPSATFADSRMRLRELRPRNLEGYGGLLAKHVLTTYATN